MAPTTLSAALQDDLESYRTLSAACGEARYYFALCALRLGAAAGGDIPAEEWEAAEGTLVQVRCLCCGVCGAQAVIREERGGGGPWRGLGGRQCVCR